MSLLFRATLLTEVTCLSSVCFAIDRARIETMSSCMDRFMVPLKIDIVIFYVQFGHQMSTFRRTPTNWSTLTRKYREQGPFSVVTVEREVESWDAKMQIAEFPPTSIVLCRRAHIWTGTTTQ